MSKDEDWMSDAALYPNRKAVALVPKSEVDDLRAEVTLLTTSGIVEVAAHNPSVMDWMKHWEDRTLKAEAEVERLRAALADARDSVEAWAAYASDYFKEKHDLAGDLARIDAALKGKS